MKQCNKLLALVLALVIIFSNANLGLAQMVSAAEVEYAQYVTTGKLLKDAYGITEAEKNLIDTYLASETYGYNVPNNGDDMISIGDDVVEVASFENWTITEVRLVPADGSDNEIITLTDGKGTYDYAGNAFSIEVDYELTQNVAVSEQEKLLSAVAELKRALAELATSANTNVNESLAGVVSALPALKDLADNGFGITFPVTLHYYLDEATVNAVNTLYAQLGEDGKLDLQVENESAYADNELKYLADNGVDYVALVKETRDCLKVFLTDEVLSSDNMMKTLKELEPDIYLEVSAFMGIVGDLITALDTVADTTVWDFSAVADGADYAGLLTAVNAIETPTVVSGDLEEKLFVSKTMLNKGRSMWNININVKVETLGANNVLFEEFTDSGVVTLIDGTVAADSAIAVAAKVAELLGDFDLAQHVVFDATELPETLTADTTYTIVYHPKQYEITTNYGEDASVYYGHVYILPVNTTEGKEFDYMVNGTPYVEGSVIVIKDNTEINRTEIADYEHYDLYSVIADNFGNPAAKDILKSGVLLGSEDIRVQVPSIENVSLHLEDDILTVTGAIAFAANYHGLNWNLYYGVGGFENAFSSNSVEWTGPQANYGYMLYLSNYSADDVQAVMDMVVALKGEAAGQLSALTRLYGYYNDLTQLDNMTISALKGIIDGHTFVDDADQNEALRAHFKNYLTAIGPECQNLVAVMGAENNNTLRHYYSNSAAMIASVAELSANLEGMLPDQTYQDYLGSLFDSLEDTKFEEYIKFKDKINNLKNSMAEIKGALKAPNAVINLAHAKVGELADMLQNGGSVGFETAAVPFIKTATDNVTDSSMVNVLVTVVVDGEKKTFSLSQPLIEGSVLPVEAVEDIWNQINAFLAANLKCDVEFYTVTGSLALDELAGNPLNETYVGSITYEIKPYTVTMNGEPYKEITAAAPVVDLPVAPMGYVYNFKVNGIDYVGSSYSFNVNEIRNGKLAVTYTVVDVKTNDFEEAFNNSEIFTPGKDQAGEYVALDAIIDANKDGIMEFAFALKDAGYEYIGLNGKPLLVSTDAGLEVCVQTLVDALMADPSFSSNKLIELGLGNPMARSNSNHFLSATIQLGSSAEKILWDLDFNMFLSTVPSKMVTVAQALQAVDGSFWFEAAEDHMEVYLNLPEKVYEMYLSAALAAGYKSNDDLTDVDIQIAYAYLCDAIELFGDSNITVDHFQAALDKLHIDRDLTAFAPFYNKIKSAIASGAITVTNNTENVGVLATAQGETINTLMNMLGIDLNELKGTVKIKEVAENGFVTLNSEVSIENAPSAYEALIIDVNAIKSGAKDFTDGITYGDLLTLIKGQGLANGLDYTENLADRLNGVGACAVMLLDDIDGDLIFNGTTILDLNGKTINGSITGNGHVYILDSNLVTSECGIVTGTVSGNVSIMAGKYTGMDTAAVEAMLPDGYKYENGFVSNALYIIEGEENNLSFVINTDVMYDENVEGYIPNVGALAADIVADVILNSYLTASLNADGNVIYNIGLDRILSIKDENEPFEELINAIMNCVDVEGSSTFMNQVVADLLAFGDIANAIENEEAVATYTLSTSPWTAKIYNNNGNIDLGVVPNANAAREITISLTFVGENRQEMVNVFEHLDKYSNAAVELNIKQPVYDDHVLYLAGDGFAKLDIDLTTNKDWQTVIAVILAYGNPDKADDLIAAIDNEAALKSLFNDMTVEEVFTAVKAMNRNTSFAEMAEELGVELNAPGRESLEKLYHLALCGFGKVLEKLDITGYTNKTMGMLEMANTGRYVLSADTNKHADATYRGFTVDVKGVVNTSSVSVAIFGDGLVEIAFANMTLANSLSMNYAFEKDQVADWTGYYIEIVKTYADGRPNVVVQIPYGDQWIETVINGVAHYYVAFDGIAAKEMTDVIYVTICNPEGVAISDVWEDSVRDYAMRMINRPDYANDVETMAMAVDMLIYGAASQEFFGYNTEDLADNELTAEQKAMATQTKPEMVDYRVYDDRYYGSSLTLVNKIQMNFAFKNGVDGMYAEVSFTDHYGHEVNEAADLRIDNGFAIVDVDEIAVADGRQKITVTVYNADGSVYSTVTDSVESYISRVNNLAPLFELIMKFADSSHAFFH